MDRGTATQLACLERPETQLPAATLLRPGHNCAAVARAERVTPIIDAAAYFDAFASAAERAQRSILILAWDFDSRTPLHMETSGRAQQTLGALLNRLAATRRQLRIRILNWDYPMIYGTDREFPPIYGLAWKPHRHIDFRFDATHPVAGSHHQKIVVIDDRLAFVGGLDLTNRRWDTPRHEADDPRRTFNGERYPPFHDVMVAVDGEAAAAVAHVARERWYGATGQRLAPVEVDADPWPPQLRVAIANAPVGIACTAPPAGELAGVHHIESLYLDMIARARHCIYIENQYFTAGKIASALASRLAEPDGPEVVLVTRRLSNGWLEELTMHTLRCRLVRELRSADRYGRFRAYFPDVCGLAEGTCIDTHAKVMVVDDEWLRIGSANLNNRSMGLDSECDVVVEAQGVPEVQAQIRAFRERLVAEHVGADPNCLALEIARRGSLAAAIEALGREERRLVTLEAPEVSDTVVSLAAVGDPERPISLDSLVQSFSPETRPRRLHAGAAALGAVLIAALIVTLAWRYTPLASYLTVERANQWADSFAGYWWAPLIVVFAYTPASLILFPRWLITLAAVIAFGAWVALPLAYSGVLLAALSGYCAGRLVDRNTVRRLAGTRLNRLSSHLRRRSLLAVTLVRLVPVAPFMVINAVMGGIRIRVRDFVLGTILGMLPGMLATTVLGGQLKAGLAGPAHVNVWVISAVALATLTMAYAAKRWLARA